MFAGVEARIVDSCTDFNDFVSRLCRNGRGMIFDDSYTVFNDFALAKEGAQDGFGGVGRTSRAAIDAKTAIIESVTC